MRQQREEGLCENHRTRRSLICKAQDCPQRAVCPGPECIIQHRHSPQFFSLEVLERLKGEYEEGVRKMISAAYRDLECTFDDETCRVIEAIQKQKDAVQAELQTIEQQYLSKLTTVRVQDMPLQELQQRVMQWQEDKLSLSQQVGQFKEIFRGLVENVQTSIKAKLSLKSNSLLACRTSLSFEQIDMLSEGLGIERELELFSPRGFDVVEMYRALGEGGYNVMVVQTEGEFAYGIKLSGVELQVFFSPSQIVKIENVSLNVSLECLSLAIENKSLFFNSLNSQLKFYDDRLCMEDTLTYFNFKNNKMDTFNLRKRVRTHLLKCQFAPQL